MLMNIFLTCLFKGVYKEYSWLYKEYNKSWSNPKNYSELSPKEIKFIINKYETDLQNEKTKKLIFKNVKIIQEILNNRLKKYQSETYNDFNSFGNLREFRFYQFIVAYKKALENFYTKIIMN